MNVEPTERMSVITNELIRDIPIKCYWIIALVTCNETTFIFDFYSLLSKANPLFIFTPKVKIAQR